jgi:hypothetical protein
MKKNALTAQKAELDASAALPDDQINTAALPEQRDWSGARRSLFLTKALCSTPRRGDD